MYLYIYLYISIPKHRYIYLYWDRLFGPKRPLLIFRGTLSGKTKQNKEKPKTKNARLFHTNEP